MIIYTCNCKHLVMKNNPRIKKYVEEWYLDEFYSTNTTKDKRCVYCGYTAVAKFLRKKVNGDNIVEDVLTEDIKASIRNT